VLIRNPYRRSVRFQVCHIFGPWLTRGVYVAKFFCRTITNYQFACSI
jgi:hypothetical protein